jgi:phosphosulfolactate synthase
MHSLVLPSRQAKPRERGLTMVIDNGVPSQLFEDVISSCGEYVDLVKFGWGTALVTPDIKGKIAALQQHNIQFMFGGTLFEKHVLQGRVEEYREFCLEHECQVVEVSNGTIDLGHEEKAGYISKLAADFQVIAEVGFKDHPRSEMFAPSQWVASIQQDLDAGARAVILEARESGTSGICRPDGEIRFGLIEDILGAGVDVGRLIFETPTKALQTYFIKRIGPEANLGNIAMTDIIGVETLRLGLRADTLLDSLGAQ